MRTYLFVWLLVGSTSVYSIDLSSCHYDGTPEIVPVKCGEKCQTNLCQGKVECDWGAGPVLMAVSCVVPKGHTSCPSAVKCARSSSAKYKDQQQKKGATAVQQGGSDVSSH